MSAAVKSRIIPIFRLHLSLLLRRVDFGVHFRMTTENIVKTNTLTTPEICSYILAAIALFLVVKFSMLVALFSGLLVYSLAHLLVPTIEKRYSSTQARTIAVVMLSSLIVLIISAAIWAVVIFLRSDASNLQHLLQKLADIIEGSRNQLPLWVSTNLPDGVVALREWLTEWLREHSAEAKGLSKEAGHVVLQLVLGMIIGSLVALQDATTEDNYRPFAKAMLDRIVNLNLMFGKIVYAQVRISLINTAFTAIYLLVILPMAGVHLPLTKSMIAITFLVGLIPVVGNIVSNTVIVIVGLSHSLQIAVASLVFMVVIHKLEYFLNARIIGSQINARAWEMLTAILVMETLFGMPGLVAAPVFYAYVKKELTDRELV